VAQVLIIDDDRDSLDAVAGYLAKAGHSVRCACSGAEALNLLSDAVPQAVVLDVRMPDMDGIALLGVMRSYLTWATVPVALFTAFPDDPRLWHVGESGVSRVFAKAVQPAPARADVDAAPHHSRARHDSIARSRSDRVNFSRANQTSRDAAERSPGCCSQTQEFRSGARHLWRFAPRRNVATAS
jgi:DNA-binding response OmpR family regulator